MMITGIVTDISAKQPKELIGMMVRVLEIKDGKVDCYVIGDGARFNLELEHVALKRKIRTAATAA